MEEAEPIDALRAVLLFHESGPWTDEKRRMWFDLTGRHEATTKALCDFVREALAAATCCGDSD